MLDPEFLKSLSGEDRFLIDLACISEHNRRETERLKKDTRKAQDARDHPGMERFDSSEDFWHEVELAEAETHGDR